MDVLISAAALTSCTCQVAGEDFARPRSHHQNRTQITRKRRKDVTILVIEGIRRADRGCLLSQAAKQSADDFALLQKYLQPLLERPGEMHIVEQLELLVLREFHQANVRIRLDMDRHLVRVLGG